jgi:hypothetical protein
MKCSGLEVVRYDPDALHGQFGSNFRLLRHLTEIHQTPTGGRAAIHVLLLQDFRGGRNTGYARP